MRAPLGHTSFGLSTIGEYSYSALSMFAAFAKRLGVVQRISRLRPGLHAVHRENELCFEPAICHDARMPPAYRPAASLRQDRDRISLAMRRETQSTVSL